MSFKKVHSLIPKLILISFFSWWILPNFFSHKKAKEIKENTTSGAGHALDAWAWERIYPAKQLPTYKYVKAFNEKLKNAQPGGKNFNDRWQSVGPQNVGGRTLALAFHPTDPDIIFAGSASGGLWKTTTAGKGSDAWQEIPTGFPVLGVSTIAIDPKHPDTMYIGTGEVYSIFDVTQPGEINRLTRGTYGIGILKTTDGGATWEKSLDWTLDDLRGVQTIAFDPEDSQVLYAATTEGLYQSTNGGENWNRILNFRMAVDVVVKPDNPNTIFVTVGNLNFNNNSLRSGIYVSTNKGQSFRQVTNGLPRVFSGKAMMAFSESNPQIVYASIQVIALSSNQATTPLGLYRSLDGGLTWEQRNNTNVAIFQGWYSHDIAIDPSDPNNIIYVGVDTWKSENGGAFFTKKSDWSKWTFGTLPNSGPDGPADYVHADIHAAYYHPLKESHVYLATDGGIFVSEDGGESFESRNEGYITTQFYPRFDNSTFDTIGIIGGTQDNATYLRLATNSWSRVVGGDGMSAYFDLEDPEILYASAQGLFLTRSNDGGQNFQPILPSFAENEFAAFNGPYAISPSAPNILCTAGRHFYKSLDRGNNWTEVSNGAIDFDNVVLNITIAPNRSNLIYISTVPDPFSGLSSPNIFRSLDSGQTWDKLTGLPNAVCKDIAIDPTDEAIIYAVYSGFGDAHVFKSENSGDSWENIDGNLPDIPTNTILIDPLNSNDIYIGNDLGVYYSGDQGGNWQLWSEGLPDATLVVDLDISPLNRKLRVATHGRGIYERDLAFSPLTDVEEIETSFLDNWKIFPNPISSQSVIEMEVKKGAAIALAIVDLLGRKTNIIEFEATAGKYSIPIPSEVDALPKGNYFIELQIGKKRSVKKLVKL